MERTFGGMGGEIKPTNLRSPLEFVFESEVRKLLRMNEMFGVGREKLMSLSDWRADQYLDLLTSWQVI